MERFCAYYFILSSCFLIVVKSSTVVVDSPFGKIQGAKKTDDSTRVSYVTFKGIPYAKPPLGELRFAKPQPHPKIDGVFDASKGVKVMCPHPPAMMANETNFYEDCLILNVQTKEIGLSAVLRKVVVFIHGGGFYAGSSSFYESKSFVISQGVIVVTINYRLGVLGFLTTENEASPGNYGLWDQALAIKWVKDNIRAFGGDPDDITIAGESAGAISVGFQSISPHTKGLFTKVYPHSGTPSSMRTLNPQSQALTLAKLAGCWDKDVDAKIDVQESKTMIDCLRKAPLSAITQFNNFGMKVWFGPTVDGDFVPDLPVKLLQDEDYLESIGFFDRSYFVGINSNEQAITKAFMKIMKHALFADERMSQEQKESMYQSILAEGKNHHLLSRLGEAGASDDSIMDKITDYYQRRFLDDDQVFELISDLVFYIPTMEYMAAVSSPKSRGAYLLYFNHFPSFMKGEFKGTIHGMDIGYWFDFRVQDAEMLLMAGMEGEFDEEDVELKRVYSSVVGDFVKSGNPGATLKSTILPSGWPKYDVTNSYYLDFNPKPYASSFLHKDRQDFWLDTVPNLMKKKTTHVHSEL